MDETYIQFEGTDFGPLSINHCLLWYDYPMISIGIDNNGTDWLVIVLDEDREDKTTTYICTVITPEEVIYLKENTDNYEFNCYEQIYEKYDRIGYIVVARYNTKWDDIISCRSATKKDFEEVYGD